MTKLKLSEMAHLAEIIGGIGIVASLIFVGMQVRENTLLIGVNSDQTVDTQNLALNVAVAESADLADILVRGEADRESLSDVEKKRFDNYSFSRFGSYENVVGIFERGLMTQSDFDIWSRHFNDRFNRPGYRQFWIEYRDGYFPEFRIWADIQFEIED